MDTLYLLEAERHLELDVCRGVGIVGQFLVVMVAVFLVTETEDLVPAEACLTPVVEPFQLFAGTNEELHLHLLELAHTEDELTCHNLVTECLADLCDTERYTHAACFLHVEVVHEDALCGLRTKINLHRSVGSRTHLGLEHEVELTDVGPVACAAYGVNDLVVEDNLFQLIEVIGVHCLGKPCVKFVTLAGVFEYTGVGLAEHRLVEALAETLCGFCYLLVDFLVELRDFILNEDIGAITLFGILVVNQGVVERVNMARGLPDGRVHEDSRVDANDVVVEHGHSLPPIAFDIVLQLHAVLTVVING